MKRLVAAAVATVALSGLFVSGGSLTAGAITVDLSTEQDPTFIGWSEVLPTLTEGYDPTSENECKAGKISCVDKVIKEMRRRFEPMARACDHNAVFGLAYLRTTQTYRWAATTPGFFEDPGFVNHEDAVFAKYYFDAYDDWSSGNRTAVPEAWLIAFDAAKNRTVSGGGDVFLGMGAHVNRDLPYVLAGIGLVKPDGSSRKPDHDKVNQFLNKVVDPLLDEEAARFDAGANSSGSVPLMLGYTSTFQMLEQWRETAWRNAERLANATSDAERAEVAASIESYAANVQRALVAATGFVPPFTSTATRDAFCASNYAAPAPTAYVFGTPEPF